MRPRLIGIIIAGFSTIFVAFAIRYSYGLLLPEMLSGLSISKTEAGIIYSSYFLTYTLFSPLLGLLVDRFDARSAWEPISCHFLPQFSRPAFFLLWQGSGTLRAGPLSWQLF